TWGALDFASAEGNADDILAVDVFQRRLFLIGRVTTEVYYNTGESFPFNRLDGVFINYGCESSRSVAVGDKSIMWLGRGLNGQLCVISVGENMAETIISTPAL